ncbi:uncharacterized protein LOC111947084 [Oryzias latipes]|uniref:uncharacterized protein LOC111947084 n=1 Tax=Oryzias latipes TaxID=8090 RepID=UPI000CE266D6|nr:uncharacterized protein LOC111947084 [Oryzias latipes]
MGSDLFGTNIRRKKRPTAPKPSHRGRREEKTKNFQSHQSLNWKRMKSIVMFLVLSTVTAQPAVSAPSDPGYSGKDAAQTDDSNKLTIAHKYLEKDLQNLDKRFWPDMFTVATKGVDLAHHLIHGHKHLDQQDLDKRSWSDIFATATKGVDLAHHLIHGHKHLDQQDLDKRSWSDIFATATKGVDLAHHLIHGNKHLDQQDMDKRSMSDILAAAAKAVDSAYGVIHGGGKGSGAGNQT